MLAAAGAAAIGAVAAPSAHADPVMSVPPNVTCEGGFPVAHSGEPRLWWSIDGGIRDPIIHVVAHTGSPGDFLIGPPAYPVGNPCAGQPPPPPPPPPPTTSTTETTPTEETSTPAPAAAPVAEAPTRLSAETQPSGSDDSADFAARVVAMILISAIGGGTAWHVLRRGV